MKNVSKFAALALVLGMTAPAMAAMNNTLVVDPNATTTNAMINKMDTIKGDTSPHVNAPASIKAKAPDAAHMPHHAMRDVAMRDSSTLTQAERDAIAQKRMQHRADKKAMNPAQRMSPAQREAHRKEWQAKRAEWAKMTPAERAAAKEKWESERIAR